MRKKREKQVDRRPPLLSSGGRKHLLLLLARLLKAHLQTHLQNHIQNHIQKLLKSHLQTHPYQHLSPASVLGSYSVNSSWMESKGFPSIPHLLKAHPLTHHYPLQKANLAKVSKHQQIDKISECQKFRQIQEVWFALAMLECLKALSHVGALQCIEC